MNVMLNRKLNLVLSIETERGKLYIHSAPISRSVFEDNFMVISRAFTAIYTNGLGPVAGPRVAKLLLKEEAEKLGLWERTQQSLMGEIYRLTNVLLPAQDKPGWESMPYDAARKRGVIDDDSAAEVENPIVYFTCASSIHMRSELLMALDGLKALWGAQTTLSPSTEFMRSLTTSTPEETTGENTEPAPVPMERSLSSIPQ